MVTDIVNRDELYEIMQQVNLIKTKIGTSDTWVVYPILYTTEDSVDIIVENDKAGHAIELGQKVVFKFQRFGYEYIVNGEIVDLCRSSSLTATIKYSIVQKYENLRKTMRFDTNLMVSINNSKSDLPVDSVVKDISRGGAMLVAPKDLDLNSLITMKVAFNSGNHFSATAKVLRKSSYGQSGFGYGVEFTNISEGNSKIINSEIAAYEKEYFKSLSILRKYNGSNEEYFGSKIAVFSINSDGSRQIGEELVKLGADNFEIFYSFRHYIDSFLEEKPKLVIIDADEFNEELTGTIEEIKKDFPGTNVLLLVPVERGSKKKKKALITEKPGILFKPLIYKEFQGELIKYL